MNRATQNKNSKFKRINKKTKWRIYDGWNSWINW